MRRAGAVRQGLVGFVVAFLSLALLVYVAMGEAARIYPKFQVAKMAAQAELLQNALGRHLRAGLPLRQLPGFRQLAEPILASDPSLAAIAAHDDGGTVFVAGEASVPRLTGTADGTPAVRRDRQWLQIELPLRSRFETVGALTVTMPVAAASGALSARLPWLAGGILGLSALYGLLAAGLAGRVTRVPWLALAYATMFGLAAAAVVASLLALYAEGAQAKARALAASLAQRLQPPVSYGLDLAELSGLDRALAEYRDLNPDIDAVAVLIGDTAALHTDPASIGHPWQAGTDRYAYVEPVGAAGGELRVAVALPASVVWQAVARSIKNFAALFIASGLLAALFLQLGRSLAASEDGQPTGEPAALALLRPIFFLAIFVESLGAGFLPQLVDAAATAAGHGRSAGAAAFTVYFLCFLIVLVPAGRAVERRGPRPLIVAGAALAAAALLLQALAPGYAGLLVARALAGTGQGLLFIGVQSALLEHAPPGQRTRAATIIVLGFNGGMIAGAAIGSLLVEDLGPRGVFLSGAAIGLLLAVYARLVIARRGPASAPPTVGLGRLIRDLGQALASRRFLRALLLIGAPSKAVLTGVVGFALPIMLSGTGWHTEDVGQVIMLYACGVLAASGPVARLVDRGGRCGIVVGLGGIGAGLALLLMSAGAVAPVVAGVVVLGLAHGLVNAPVITYVTESGAAERLGAGGAAALYRVVERVGHALGPLLVGQLLAMAGAGLAALAWIGAAILTASVLFMLPLVWTAGRRAA